MLAVAAVADEKPKKFAKLHASAGLSAEKKSDLFNTNIHHIQQLNNIPKKCVVDFLKDLELHETYIRLEQAIKNGHSVIYHFVEGKSPRTVSRIARKHKLKVVKTRQCKCADCCGRIVLPGANIVEAVAVPGSRQERGGEARKVHAKPRKRKRLRLKRKMAVTKEQAEDAKRKRIVGGKLQDAQKKWYYDNNVAQASKMHAKAGPLVKKFLDDLREKAPNTVLHLMEPVPNGHTVRFHLVEGSASPIRKYVGACGLRLEGGAIVAPEGKPVHAEGSAPNTDGHLHTAYRNQGENGVPEKLKIVKTEDRNVVKKLKDKWIKKAKKLF